MFEDEKTFRNVHPVPFTVWIEPQGVDASQYDPDSIMHYAFPAEFTTNGVAFGGSHLLSPLDKELIAREYPRDAKPKVRRRYERKIAVRNETDTPLEVALVYETRASGKPQWLPESDPTVAPSTRVPAGAERVLDGQGRKVKLVARSVGGAATWSEHAETPLRIAPKGGYLDVEPQTYVVVIDGPPDQPEAQTKEELWSAASSAETAGRHDVARGLFGEYIERFPGDPLVPWAHFNVAAALLLIPSAFSILYKTGPLAWDGAVSFMLRNAVLVIWALIRPICLAYLWAEWPQASWPLTR